MVKPIKLSRKPVLEGEIIRNNSQYVLSDNKTLEQLTISHTVLRPTQSTNGHKHDLIDEIYVIVSGSGRIQYNPYDAYQDDIAVQAGDIILIPKGCYHKVCNNNPTALEFLSIFKPYERQ